MAVWTILGGLICIAMGMFGNEFYGANDAPTPGETPIPKWLGRLGFIGIGFLFVVAGIVLFMNGNSSK